MWKRLVLFIFMAMLESSVALAISKNPPVHEPDLDRTIREYIQRRGNQIAAVGVVDVQTGKILSFAEGQYTKEALSWQKQIHTGFYAGFPAASIYKIVVAATLLEQKKLDVNDPLPFNGSCSQVSGNFSWLSKIMPKTSRNPMSLKRAFSKSCNGFFANIVLEHTGVHALQQMTENLLGKTEAKESFSSKSLLQIGRLAAGFSNLGLSVHEALQLVNRVVPENNGNKIHFADAIPVPDFEFKALKPETSKKLLEIMAGTTSRGGTASSTFRYHKYRHLSVGGKTGTLNSLNPKGTTTWFVGGMPAENPEVVVASVVLLKGLWHIRAVDLAAEALYQYDRAKNMLTAH